ncbi:MAG TPA: PadR family transcriptional regulator [Solirubrobacteraceae bacterium]
MPRRFFRHGELPLVLLALLTERPRHGYEIMAELKRLFGPRYRPSPGSVYPAIEALHAEGLIDGQIHDGKTTYRVTPAGEQALQARRDALAALEVRTGARFGDADSIELVLDRFRARLVPLSGRVDPQAIAAVLQRAAADIESLDELPTTKEAN